MPVEMPCLESTASVSGKPHHCRGCRRKISGGRGGGQKEVGCWCRQYALRAQCLCGEGYRKIIKLGWGRSFVLVIQVPLTGVYLMAFVNGARLGQRMALSSQK